MDQEPPGRWVRMVPLRMPNPGPPLQVVPQVEAATEDAVGRRVPKPEEKDAQSEVSEWELGEREEREEESRQRDGERRTEAEAGSEA